MLSTLLHWDAFVFECINSGLSNPVFDTLLPWFREKLFWAPAYLFLTAFLIQNYKRQAIWLMLGMLFTVALSDTTSSLWIKKNVERLRPCNDPEMTQRIIERVPCGGGYSFTSSHATNHFAVAVYIIGILGLRQHPMKWILLGWAAIIALSQVYVGVHYPLDVLCGGILGSMIGWMMARLTLFYCARRHHFRP